MRVLYISHGKERSGWGQASRDYILAMDAVGIDVVPRFYELNNSDPVPAKLEELAKKSSQGCDVVIQHLLPHYMCYDGRFKNIGIFAAETDNFSTTRWTENLNLMDSVWVINHDMVDACKKSNVTVPISVVPHTLDMSEFERSYEPLKLPELDDKFVFYFIGEFVRRKNIVTLLKAFHTEFEPWEPVALVIKTGLAGNNPQAVADNFQEMSRQVKAGLKLYGNNYHREVVIVENLSRQQVLQLHASCDCFVMPSMGEAAPLPVLDALAMGRPVICTAVGGMKDMVNCENGWPVPHHLEPCFAAQGLADMYTARENWAQVDQLALREAMREAYSNKDLFAKKGLGAIESAYNYSYETIGGKIKSLLEESCG